MKNGNKITFQNFFSQYIYSKHTYMFCCEDECKNLPLNKSCEDVDSPLQLKLVKMFGLHSYMLQNFIFRRKPSTYSIKSIKGVKAIFLDNEMYQPPQHYHITIQIIERNQQSIPLIKLTPNTSKEEGKVPCVVYAHGNSSDMGDSLRFLTKMTQKFRAQYVAFDYTGYGQSRMPNVGEEVICKDLELVLSWLKRPLSQIILWGFSLGTFPVVMNAARYSVKAAILQCPIGSLSCMFQGNYKQNIKFREDHFANIDHIANVRGRLLMMHSIEDEIIPIGQAHLLFKKYIGMNGQRHITFIQVEKIKHNQLHRYIVSPKQNDLQREVIYFLKTNQKQMQASKVRQIKNYSLDLLYESIQFRNVLENQEFDQDKMQITQTTSRNYRKDDQWLCCRK